MKENKEYKNDALAALKGRWAPSVLAVLSYVVLAYVIIVPLQVKAVEFQNDPTNLALAMDFMKWVFLLPLVMIIALSPLIIGLVNSFRVLLVENDDRMVRNEFRIGYGNYWHHVWGYFLKMLFVYLWSFLFVIPRIIKMFSYAMTNYILVDKPELSANEAINLSKDMMYGHKFDLFYLYLSLAGWFILSIVTLGIGFLWFYPYAQTAQASFYLDVKEDYERRTGISF